MAEGGVQPKGRGFNVEKAWEHLLFQTRDKETTYEADADFIEPCRLQFVLKSKLASGEFYTRIGKQQIFKILSSEHVGVEVDSSELADIDGFWSSLIESVNRALESKTVQSITFLSKNELETAFLNLDRSTQRLLSTGVVGVYYTYDNTSFVAKFVGSDNDICSLCEKIYEIMKKKLSYEHKLEQREVKTILDLDLVADLLEGFKDVTIQVDEEKSVVRFQGFEKGRINDCLSDLKVLIGRVQFIPLDFLSISAQQLIRKENLRKYIQEKVNVERIAFVTEGQHNYLVCKQKNIADLKSSIQNCLMERIIDRNCLHSSQWKDFFEKHGNEIIRKDHGEKTCLCFTLDLKEEVEELLSSFGKPCRDFLQTYGTNLLKTLAETHHVKEEIQQDYVCFKGLYNDGRNAMNESERRLEFSVLHFDYDEGCLFTSQKRQHLDAIGKLYRCSINAITFSQDPHTIWNKSDTGIEQLAKWKLHRNKGQISVTEVDFEKAELDGLIIPVSDCLFGEDIFGKGYEGRSYSKDCRSQGHTFELGQWEPLVFGKKYRGASCVALVTSGTAIVNNKQIHRTIGSKLRESVTDIIHDSFSRKLWKIGFAVPSDNLNFKSELNDILSGYQDVVDKFRGQQESELLVCVKQPAERWLQEVDNCLSLTVCTRRQVGPRYQGLFDKPHVNIEVTRKSLLEVKTTCLVVAISQDLDLSKGKASNLISEACGEKLQQELQSKHQHITILGEPLAVDSFNLSKQGVKKLIFGSLPAWKRHKNCDHILENFVQECLLLAESYGCSSVAFPVFGTGNLAFPLRDAVVALIDGIDRYIAETTVGSISTVYIAVPDDTTAKILDLELKRRKANSDVDVEQSHMKDHTYHFAEDGNVKCYIANETVFRALSSGRHIEVLFTPVAGKNLNIQDDSGVPERIVKTSGNSKHDLKLAFEDVIKMCEKERITSVAVHGSPYFSFSETEQVDTLLLAAQRTVCGFNIYEYPGRGQYKYLEHVFVVTSDAGYSMISNLKLADETQLETSSSFLQSLKSSIWNSPTNTELKWTRMNLKKQKVFFNVILAGGMESDLKEATHDIVNLCTTADISGDSTEMDQKTDSNKNSNAKGKLENIRKGEDFLESKLRKYRKSVPLDVPIECIENRKDEIDREMNKRECVWNLKTIQKPVKMLKHCKYLASWIDPMRELKVTVVRGISWDMDLDLQIVMTNQSLYPIEIMQSQFKVPEDFILRGKDILERRGGKLNVGEYTELLKEVNGCENFNCVALVIASDFNNKTSKDLDIRQKIKKILTKHVKGNTTNFGLSAFEGGGAQKLTKQEIEAALEFADASPGQIDELFICHQTEQMQELQKLHELFKVKRGFVLNIYSDSAKVLKHTDSDTKIEVVEGSLEKLKADVMVNTTNSVLKLDEGGVSSSVLKMAGSMIQKECKKKYPNGLKKGQIVKTNAYELKNLKFVYHISLPDYNMTTFREDVKAYVKKCLCQAERDECCSIVFPALGVGRLKYPQRETAEAMFDAAEEYSLNVINPVLKSIKFLVHVNDKMTYEAFRGEEYRRSKGCLKEIGLARPLIKKDFKALVFKTGQDSPSIKITSLQDFGIPPAYAIEVFIGHVKTEEEIYGKRASDEPHSWNDRWFLQKPESINKVTEGLGKLKNKLAELDDRVTEIVIYTNKDSTCKISEELQAKQICPVFSTTKTVFLQEVVIVVSDEPSLQRTATLLKKDVDRMNTNSRSTELSIELIGKTKEYLDDGETFITEFVQRIKQENTAYVVSRLPSSKNDFEVFDEVTADINPGIVDFKKQNNDWDA